MIYCTNCGSPREPDIQFCTSCGKQVSEASFTRLRSRGRFVMVLTALVVLLGGGIAVWVTSVHKQSPPEPLKLMPPQQSADVAPAPPSQHDDPLRTASVSTSCPPAEPGEDAQKNRFTYEPEKAIDNLDDTAWRCGGDGIGQSFAINFTSKVTLTSIGMVPGYAKTDPYDGADRYLQNRRISAVDYIFDDGITISREFDTDPLRRSMQSLSLPNVRTGRVMIIIRGSVAGGMTRGQQPLNKVAISEIAISVL